MNRKKQTNELRSYNITVWGRYPSLNEYIKALKNSKHVGDAMKSRSQENIIADIYEQKGRLRIDNPIVIHYTFIEPNKKRDMDNISGYFHKVFQDALVQAGVIVNDGWSYIRGYSDDFDVDSNNPRIEIVLEEVER
jgi:Holliday junction resolvase RusA-like endonuclease